MNARLSRIVCLCSLSISGFGQDPAPAPDGALQPPAKPNEEMLKWIETVDAQWQATFVQEVTAPFDAEKAKIAQQYATGVEAHFGKASSAGNLDLTVLWRNERDRFAAEKTVPAEDAASAPAELKQLQAAWRTHLARLEKERGERMQSVQARYDQVLAQAQIALTQKRRIEDALMVRNKREEIAALWQVPQRTPAARATPSPIAKSPAAPVETSPQVVATPTMSIHPHIGESLTDLTKRFGVWPERENNRLPRSVRYFYKRDGFQAEAIVFKDKVVMVVLHRDGQNISDDNLKEVMKANADGHTWAFDKQSGEWIRRDRAIKVFRPPGHPDFLAMQDIRAVKEIEAEDRSK